MDFFWGGGKGHCVVCSSIYDLWLPFWYFRLSLDKEDEIPPLLHKKNPRNPRVKSILNGICLNQKVDIRESLKEWMVCLYLFQNKLAFV